MASKKRIPVVAGNWKMHKNRDEAFGFLFEINNQIPSPDIVETIICVPSLHLNSMVKRQGNNLRIGAQNAHYMNGGAYTGEISMTMLKNCGVSYAIIGHSERRLYFNETDSDVNLKIKAALANSITPIVCIGETLNQNERNKTKSVLKKQIDLALLDISIEELEKVIIAYEPIWAIGTGKTALSAVANSTIAFIRRKIASLYGSKVLANKVRILYGGSVNPDNIAELLATTDIDGVLVGGASLESATFLKLVNAAANKNSK